jgi:hypothetical protein
LVWHMTTDDGRFVADDHFPLYFLSSIKKVHVCSFCFLYFNFSFYSFDFLFLFLTLL